MISCICFPRIVSFLAAVFGSLLKKTRLPIKWEVIKVAHRRTAINWQWHFEYTASTALLVYQLCFVFIPNSVFLAKRSIRWVKKTVFCVCSQQLCYYLLATLRRIFIFSQKREPFLYRPIWSWINIFKEAFIPIHNCFLKCKAPILSQGRPIQIRLWPIFTPNS